MSYNYRSIIGNIEQTASEFLDRETIGGILLMIATILALVVSNSNLSEYYFHYLETDFQLGFEGGPKISLSIEEWINDGLMVIFFLVVGMEIKRELMVGHLASWRKASMPLMAAIGGMVVPAAIYFYFNWGTEYQRGWGIPMATDIAYTLGILGLIGKRIPLQLKIFLTALAVADDMGAIMIIAFFYSSPVAWMQIALAGGLFLLMIFMNYTGIKKLTHYLVVGIPFWYCFVHSGVHPTIAGVLFALVVPMKPRIQPPYFSKRAKSSLNKLRETNLEEDEPISDPQQAEALEKMYKDAKKSLPAMLRLESALTGFNAWIVIPLFAFANAGVVLGQEIGQSLTSSLGLGIILGLVVGKAIGISLFSWVGYKMRIATLPRGLNWPQIIGVSCLAGIGFTMSLFITNLAFDNSAFTEISKISILTASALAALLGVIILLIAGRRPKIDTSETEEAAEEQAENEEKHTTND